ncbi:MAG: tetratricopeptide repeat protein [candidate division Zixibacteria bacterium]|nr:tetratricopeptide repeat protein [candidate division Zixibacteria bacterium]
MDMKELGARKVTLFLLISMLTFASCSSCVYYNTFYHAKKFYNEAERNQSKNEDGKANQNDKAKYEDAIKKASKVLSFHADSKYVDDALYLIGKSYYNMEEWRKSDRKFKELIVNFPESKFVTEATFLLGMCNFHVESYNAAEEPFREILAQEKKTDFHDDASFMIAEIRYAREEYNIAIEYYNEMLKNFPKSDLKAKALARIGNCYFEQNNYSQAHNYYQQALKAGPDTDLRYEIRFAAGECLYKLGDYNEGLKIYKSLVENSKYLEHVADVKLQIAEGYYNTGDKEEAIETYEEIPDEKPNTVQAAEAYYELGRIYERDGELQKAKDAYQKGSTQSRDSEHAQLCVSKASEISKLETYRSTLSDSTRQDVVDTQLLLAETMLFDFSQPDSAIREYKTILEDYPYSSQAPLAYFALGYIYREIRADTAMADSFYIELAGRYPDSPYGHRAAEILGILEMFPDSLNPEKLFSRAENKLFEEDDPDSAIMLYQQIQADHPGTEYAARASYAVSYIFDRIITPADSTDSTALYAYQAVVDNYPETEYARAAKLRLGLTKRESSRQKLGQMIEDDTTTTFNPEDTTTYSESGMDLAPEPQNKEPLIWPYSIRTIELRGKAVVKFFVDIFGEISEVELLTESGFEELDQAIIESMENSSYEAQNMEAEDLNRYYLYQYEFVSPEEAKKTGEEPPKVGPG